MSKFNSYKINYFTHSFFYIKFFVDFLLFSKIFSQIFLGGRKNYFADFLRIPKNSRIFSPFFKIVLQIYY